MTVLGRFCAGADAALAVSFGRPTDLSSAMRSLIGGARVTTTTIALRTVGDVGRSARAEIQFAPARDSDAVIAWRGAEAPAKMAPARLRSRRRSRLRLRESRPAPIRPGLESRLEIGAEAPGEQRAIGAADPDVSPRPDPTRPPRALAAAAFAQEGLEGAQRRRRYVVLFRPTRSLRRWRRPRRLRRGTV